MLNYPVPTLINWGTEEDENAYIQHLAKVENILLHLQSFARDNDDDLVLIVDGFDTIFQLRSDVLLRRYFAINEAANHRIASTFGRVVARDHGIRQTVLFGPDSLCWPSEDERRPACWAVPQSTLPIHSFGPYDDTEFVDAKVNPVYARPRWLNSGTIMGRLGDVRAVLESTLALIHENHTTDSDQYYFANLFGTQEYSRSLLQKDQSLPVDGSVDIPKIRSGQRTEFHVGLDYETAIFQSVGYKYDFIRFLRFNGVRGENKAHLSGNFNNTHNVELSRDIADSPLPFSAVKHVHRTVSREHNNLKVKDFSGNGPLDLSWGDVPLAMNEVTRQTVVLIHYMSAKELRDQWWDLMWFYPYGKLLLYESSRAAKAPIFKMPIDGRMWWNAEASHLPKSNHSSRPGPQGMGGAWSDRGDWLPWDELCGFHENEVFGRS